MSLTNGKMLEKIVNRFFRNKSLLSITFLLNMNGCGSESIGTSKFNTETNPHKDDTQEVSNFGSDIDSYGQDIDITYHEISKNGETYSETSCPEGKLYVKDNDGDGFPQAPRDELENYQLICPNDEIPPSYVLEQPEGPDCDDNHLNIHPKAEEVCDYIDNDCDGKTDEGVTIDSWKDKDGDGQGDKANPSPENCKLLEGYVTNPLDCNDYDKTIYQGAKEVCDNKDNDCDGFADETLTKKCYNACNVEGIETCITGTWQNCNAPELPQEVCDYIDNDCDDEIDEEFDLLIDPNNCGSCGKICLNDYICEAGFCVQVECIDSDDGKNYYEKGEIIGPLLIPESPTVDMCIGEDDLREMFCNEEGLGEPTLYTCECGCEEGACIGACAEPECLDGQIEKIECETNSPCKGFKTKECVNGEWGEWNECNHLVKIMVNETNPGNYTGPVSIFEDTVIWRAFDDYCHLKILYTYNFSSQVMEIINLSELGVDNVETFLAPLFKFKENNLLLQGCSKSYVYSLDNKTIEFIEYENPGIPDEDLANGSCGCSGGSESCFDVTEELVGCFGNKIYNCFGNMKATFGNIWLYNLSNGEKTIINLSDNEEIKMVRIPFFIYNNKIVYIDFDESNLDISLPKSYNMRTYNFETQKMEILWQNLVAGGIYPLAHKNNIVFKLYFTCGLDDGYIFKYNLETSALENLTATLKINCDINTTTSLYNNLLACNGDGNVKLFNILTGSYATVSNDKGSSIGIFKNKVVLSKELGIDGPEGVYYCELKDEWVE